LLFYLIWLLTYRWKQNHECHGCRNTSQQPPVRIMVSLIYEMKSSFFITNEPLRQKYLSLSLKHTHKHSFITQRRWQCTCTEWGWGEGLSGAQFLKQKYNNNLFLIFHIHQTLTVGKDGSCSSVSFALFSHLTMSCWMSYNYWGDRQMGEEHPGDRSLIGWIVQGRSKTRTVAPPLLQAESEEALYLKRKQDLWHL